MPLGWFTSEFGHPGSAVKDSNSHSGNFALRLAGGDTVAFATSATIVREELSYEFAGYAYVPGFIGGGVMLQFLNSRGGLIGTPVVIPVGHSSDYRLYSRWVTAPDSAFFLSVTCLAMPSGEVYFDDVTVDDTSRMGLRQPEGGKRVWENRRVRKLVAPLTGTVQTQARFYDVLGRKVEGLLPARGVYFVITE